MKATKNKKSEVSGEASFPPILPRILSKSQEEIQLTPWQVVYMSQGVSLNKLDLLALHLIENIVLIGCWMQVPIVITFLLTRKQWDVSLAKKNWFIGYFSHSAMHY